MAIAISNEHIICTFTLYGTPLKFPLWKGWPQGPNITKIQGHFVGNHFQASSHFVACTNLKGLKGPFQTPFCREPTCTLPYCKSNRIDDLGIKTLGYSNLDNAVWKLGWVRAIHFVGNHLVDFDGRFCREFMLCRSFWLPLANPSFCMKSWALAKSLQNEWVQVKKKPIQNGRACVHQRSPLTSRTGQYLAHLSTGCSISIFFWVWILLACLDLAAQKRHRFVRREISEKEVLTKRCIFWATRSKHASKIHTQKKIKHRTSGLSIPPYKMWGWWKELVDAYGPTILWGYFFLGTQSFCRFFSRPHVL